MISLTPAQIQDAKNNELSAVTAVIEATEERVLQLASKYATISYEPNPHLAEDMAQEARTAVWLALQRFEGETVAEFFAYVDTTIKGVLSDHRRTETRKGASSQAAKDFEAALRVAGGDPYLAERVCTVGLPNGRKLSREQANAARLAWMGVDYLDAPIAGTEGETLADRLADELDVPADLVEPRDLDDARRRFIRQRVHTVLGMMGARQRRVLKATFGIAPVPFYGTENDKELAADIGMEYSQIRQTRAKGRAAFADMYVIGA
ncbi:sigma-70 family RNA polymerase sigma factor [Kitasatospora sp. YST-16]|uniref:sigma-70 family RNA polymerase sigma factor n=1 Tax=Kitasatospora sp. YST-16 TaxID=2998080 RepID=UPI0022844E6E|nr:sigma-70 family RNA polymerase sigma factor [Kitasatospora sp. YST-16]WAL73131.1 sigma-70 family RNA polymerase sigma factor [Kitasatospora sp. YST-16]WNW39185.1 sigma-70 family RNA polymerase sigma factor [Streptomyces sp. Li-HN-5-13]